jgi:hypothetical protein
LLKIDDNYFEAVKDIKNITEKLCDANKVDEDWIMVYLIKSLNEELIKYDSLTDALTLSKVMI